MIAAFTKKFQSFVLSLYRIISFGVLTSIVTGVLAYVTLLIFYTLSSSWASPLVLSPTQEKVLGFQPTIATLIANIDKQEVELKMQEITADLNQKQLTEAEALLVRARAAQKIEAADLMETSRNITAVLDLTNNLKTTTNIFQNRSDLFLEIDKELTAGIISKTEASDRVAAFIDAQGVAVQWASEAKLAKQTADTFLGGSANITALRSEQQIQQVHSTVVNLRVSVEIGKQTIAVLKKSLDANRRAFATAKQSPYYRALHEAMTVAFVPYENIGAATVDAPVYDCYLHAIACRKVGKIVSIYDAEDYSKHPLFRTDLKGKLIEIAFTNPNSSRSRVVFVNSKPLLL